MIAISLLCLGNLWPISAVAQFGIPSEGISVSLSPRSPGEYADVTVSLSGNTFDIDRASIKVSVDGKTIAEGRGVKTATFTTGSIGKPMQIRVQATAFDGSKHEESLSINPAEVDLIYEATSYSHPLYKGKDLLPPNARVTLIAMPHMKSSNGSSIDPQKLVYTWKEGAKVLGKQSGTGKQVLTLTGPQVYRSKQITVEVSTQDALTQASRSITLTPQQSRSLVYQLDSALGLLLQRGLLGTVTSKDKEITLVHLPYFFSIDTRNEASLQTTWRINDKKASSLPSDSGTIVLRPEGTGVAYIEFEAQGTESYLESGQTGFNLRYSTQQ